MDELAPEQSTQSGGQEAPQQDVQPAQISAQDTMSTVAEQLAALEPHTKPRVPSDGETVPADVADALPAASAQAAADYVVPREMTAPKIVASAPLPSPDGQYHPATLVSKVHNEDEVEFVRATAPAPVPAAAGASSAAAPSRAAVPAASPAPEEVHERRVNDALVKAASAAIRDTSAHDTHHQAAVANASALLSKATGREAVPPTNVSTRTTRHIVVKAHPSATPSASPAPSASASPAPSRSPLPRMVPVEIDETITSAAEGPATPVQVVSSVDQVDERGRTYEEEAGAPASPAGGAKAAA